MSTKPAPGRIPQLERMAVPANKIPELTQSYRKAHKNYVLASGLLASWELVGITLQTKEKWGIELKSPAGVPLILVILVLYFGYKTGIEWWQCDQNRKQHPAAKWDYRISHVIAFVALAISLTQYLLQIQIVDALSNHPVVVVLITSLVVWSAAIPGMLVSHYGHPLKKALWILTPIAFTGLSLILLASWWRDFSQVRSDLLWAFVISISVVGVLYWSRGLLRLGRSDG